MFELWNDCFRRCRRHPDPSGPVAPYHERLEERRLMAVDIQMNVTSIDGTLVADYTLRSDDAGDKIIVEIGQERAYGSHDISIAVNGTSRAAPYPALSVYIAGNGGSDTIRVSDPTGHPLDNDLSPAITGGDGSDTIYVYNTQSPHIRGDDDEDADGVGDGHDTIQVVDTAGGAFKGGGGDDYITVEGYVLNMPVIDGEGGDDYVTCLYVDDTDPNLVDEWGCDIHGGDGNDELIGSYFNDNIEGGLGNDTIYALGGDDHVITWDDNGESDYADGGDHDEGDEIWANVGSDIFERFESSIVT